MLIGFVVGLVVGVAAGLLFSSKVIVAEVRKFSDAIVKAIHDRLTAIETALKERHL